MTHVQKKYYGILTDRKNFPFCIELLYAADFLPYQVKSLLRFCLYIGFYEKA